MSTGENIALATISGLVGYGLRQKTIDGLQAEVAQLSELLEQAKDIIQEKAREVDRRARSEAAKDAEIARLRELVPPERLEGNDDSK